MGHIRIGRTFSAKPTSGKLSMARKTNYDFERREREKNKAAEAAKKAQAKADKRNSEHTASSSDRAPGS
jgi:hypothetical protein